MVENAEANSGQALNGDSPWPGLDSFSEDGQAFFHGRDREIDELVRLVKREPLTVLFGQSGLGKTSLLRAGMSPRLRAEEFLPIYIRLDVLNTELSLANQVKSAIWTAFRESRIETREPSATESLWQYFHAVDTEFWNDRNRLVTPVLAFDQFEEIFTLTGAGSQDARRAFIEELADLIECRTPRAVAASLEADETESSRYDFGKQTCKVVLSFREDYLPDFEGLRRQIPSIMTNRMRLTRMRSGQAMEVILTSGEHLVAPEVAERIVRFAGSQRAAGTAGRPDEEDLEALEIEPALLSVVCRELNSKRIAAGQMRITSDLVADAEDEIIVKFYRSSLDGIDPRVQEFIEERLLTTGGFRSSAPLEDALLNPGVSQEAIDTLIGRRLLRMEERFGAQQIELTHDLLTKVIKEERDRRRAHERELEVQRTRTRRMTVMGGSVAAVAVVGLVAILYLNTISRQYERERNQLLGYMTQNVGDVASKLRLVPATSSVIVDMTRDVEAFTKRFRKDLEAREILRSGDRTALDRLDATALIVKAYQEVVGGDLTEALAQLEGASQKLIELAAKAPDDIEIKASLSELWNTKGLTYRLQRKLPQAYDCYMKAVRLGRELVRLDPGTDSWKEKLSAALNGAGEMANALGRVAEFEEMIAERQKIVLDDRLAKMPKSETWRREYASVLWMQAALAMRRAKSAANDEDQRKYFGEALVHYDSQRHMLRELVAGGGSDWRTKFYLHFADFRQGNAMLQAGKLDEAERHLESAREFIEGLKKQDPGNSFWRIVSALVHGALGSLRERQADTLLAAGRKEEAKGVLAQAVAAYEINRSDRDDIRKRDPQNLGAYRELADASRNLAEAMEKAGRPGEAHVEYVAAQVALREFQQKVKAAEQTGAGAKALTEDFREVEEKLKELEQKARTLRSALAR